MDKSNGYENIASIFIQRRGQDMNGIGASTVRNWSKTLPYGSTVLDLGCGTGFPISKVLMDEGMIVFGIDASPTLVKKFQENLPNSSVICESVEASSFFDRTVEGIVACGLMFLLSPQSQDLVIRKAANALQIGGKFLFTAPIQAVEWEDVLTGQLSMSLGSATYEALLQASGLSLVGEYEDEGGNHYFDAVKIKLK